MTELKPCPFCGGIAKLEYDWTRDGFSCGVYCEDNPSFHRMTIAFPFLNVEGEQVAIEKVMAEWNTRATHGGGKLTAEQVREAIFHGSVYASYDGAQYYANGIDMHAIADELNDMLWNIDQDALPMTEENMRKHGWVRERTCKMRLVYEDEDADGCIWPDHYECSACGAKVNGIMPYFDTEIPPHYCPNCGRKVDG